MPGYLIMVGFYTLGYIRDGLTLKEDLNCSAAWINTDCPWRICRTTSGQYDSLITKFVPKTTNFHGNSKCSPIKALDTAAFVFV